MNSRTLRRVGIIINYLSFLLFLILIYFDEKGGWVTDHFKDLSLSVLVVISITLYFLFKRTKLFELVELKSEKMDERELLFVYKATHYSYRVFIPLILISIFFVDFDFHIQGHLHGLMEIEAVFAFAFAYLAMTMPPSIIAWTEREV